MRVSGMRISPTADYTVDHMVAKSRDWRLVREHKILHILEFLFPFVAKEIRRRGL